MRNRAALTTAVTPVARETARPEHPSGRVFGKVARPDHSGTGVRGQDIELFDATVRLPKVPAPAAPPSPRSRKSRPAPTAPLAWRPMSLPLMVAGALSAGLACALTVWLSADPEPAPQALPSLALPLPDLATAAPPSAASPSDSRLPAEAHPSEAHPSDEESAHVRAARATPPPAPTSPAPSTTPSRTPVPTRSLVPTTTPPPPPSSHRPHPPSRPASRDLALGSAGPEVADLQRRLQQLYLYLGSADGVFTESVGEALSRFQVARNIPERPGVYGPLTRTALRAETD
ncbi:peptidoglycan-binding protein [Streptomyces sp. NPDC056891]|uniref:peptidoglycan-binding domain-containing protein n=1 Tax=Streptomyces sp. NPDC056891 TaxID=3345961 RepID=UPI00368A2542